MEVTLEVWAKTRFNPCPPISTLRRWARLGLIHPQPQLVGRQYRVLDTAERVGAPRVPARTLVERLRDDAR